MTTLYTDSFTYANGSLDNANWDTLTSETSLQVLSNQVVRSAFNVDNTSYVNSTALPSSPNDQWMQVTLVAVGGNADPGGSGIGGALRCSTSARTTYRVICSNDTASFAKMVAGAYTLILTGSNTLVAGDVLYGEVQASALVLKINTVTKVSTTDSAVTTGRPGLCHSSDTNAGSTPIWDTFSCGDFASASMPPGLGPNVGMEVQAMASTQASMMR